MMCTGEKEKSWSCNYYCYHRIRYCRWDGRRERSDKAKTRIIQLYFYWNGIYWLDRGDRRPPQSSENGLEQWNEPEGGGFWYGISRWNLKCFNWPHLLQCERKQKNQRLTWRRHLDLKTINSNLYWSDWDQTRRGAPFLQEFTLDYISNSSRLKLMESEW